MPSSQENKGGLHLLPSTTTNPYGDSQPLSTPTYHRIIHTEPRLHLTDIKDPRRVLLGDFTTQRSFPARTDDPESWRPYPFGTSTRWTSLTNYHPFASAFSLVSFSFSCRVFTRMDEGKSSNYRSVSKTFSGLSQLFRLHSNPTTHYCHSHTNRNPNFSPKKSVEVGPT